MKDMYKKFEGKFLEIMVHGTWKLDIKKGQMEINYEMKN